MAKYKGKKVVVNDVEYRLGDCIGSGGNGYVCAATAEGTLQEYAVKFLNLKKGDSDYTEKRQRFLSELQFCAKANHPNILKALGHGEFHDRLFYLMPRYAQTLREVINQEHDYIILLDYAVQLCEAVKYIHDKGVIHRDIKPENVFLNDRTVVLADFGIAHFQESSLTQSGDWLGNRNYASPEQLVKGLAHNITTACDIYAIGAVINELFTKQKPSGVQYAVISDSIPLLLSLDELLNRCMLQNPTERPSIDEVLAELKLIRGEIMQDIEISMDSLVTRTNLSDSEVDSILEVASKDMVTAKYLFHYATDTEINKLDCFYHDGIRYELSDYVKSLFFHRCLYTICHNCFTYEAHVYAQGGHYAPLMLEKPDDIKLFSQFKECFAPYLCTDSYLSDIRGQIFKLFCSCCNYHCIEILHRAKRQEELMKGFTSSPIMYIVYQLRQVLSEEDAQEMNFLDHISINWETTHSAIGDITSFYALEDNGDLYTVLSVFAEKWNIIWGKYSARKYSVKFRTRKDYDDFRQYALALAKPYHVFEGDVLQLVRVKREWEGIVELEGLNSFDILYVLSKVLGLKSVEE